MKRPLTNFVALLLTSTSAFAADPTGVNGARVSAVVPPQEGGAIVHGMNGVGWGTADGMLYVTSDLSGTMYKIDPKTFAVSIEVPFPHGGGDDVAQAPDGSLAWTATSEGELRYRRPGGEVQVIAHDVPGVNPVAFRADGRLVAGQVNVPGSPLFEIDPTGQKPKRIIATGADELNSFTFGPDGLLYAPAIKVGKMVSVDIDTGARKILAEGFGRLASVKMNSKGQLIGLESRTGRLLITDPKSGKTDHMTTLPPIVDNTATGTDDTVYISSPSDSAVIGIQPDFQLGRYVVNGKFSAIGGLAYVDTPQGPAVRVADDFGYRDADVLTGSVGRHPYIDDPKIPTGGSNDLAVRGDVVAVSRVRAGVVQLIAHEGRPARVIRETKDIKTPYGIVFVADDSVVVADYSEGRLARFDSQGVTTIAKGLAGPVGLAADGPDHVLVSEHTSGEISRVNLKTGKAQRIAKDLSQPEGLVVLADGRIVVVESGAGRVSIIDRRRGRSTVVAENLSFGLKVTRTPLEVGFGAGITVGKGGELYVACDGDSSIRKIILPPKEK